MDDPKDITQYSKDELVEAFVNTNHDIEHLDAQRQMIKETLADKLEGDGEVIGDHSVVKAKRVNFKVDLEKAKELGATKEAIDTRALKKLYDKGIKIKHSITEYLLIKPIKKE